MMMIPSLPAHTIQFSLFPHSCVGLLSHAERSADNTGYGDNCDYAGDGCDHTHDDYNGDNANNANGQILPIMLIMPIHMHTHMHVHSRTY